MAPHQTNKSIVFLNINVKQDSQGKIEDQEGRTQNSSILLYIVHISLPAFCFLALLARSLLPCRFSL